MASLALFCDQSTGISQAANKGFGIDTSDINKFRVDSIFNIAGSVKAYAMVSGTVLLQQQSGIPAKVNLILKPHDQSNFKLPIKYVVYRGLETSAFIENNNISDPNNKVKTTGSELLVAMQTIQQQRAPSDDIPIQALFGNELTPAATKNIDEFFFQNLALASQLFTIDCGVELGKFATGEVSIEVILENPEYFLTVEDAKKPLHEINVAGLSSAEKKFKQDLVRHFVDPAAYYGLHHDIAGGIEYRTGSGKQSANTPALVYSQIVNKFLTKNKVYLDVRNENGYSYNYYGNYVGTGADANKNIKIGQTATTLVAKEYYTNGWAIHTIDVTAGSGAENEIFVALRIDDNKRPLIAGWNYTLLNTSGTGTIVPDENVYFADEIVLLGSPIPNPLPDFTNAISFKVPNISGTTPAQLATVMKLDYIKQLLPLTNSNKFPRINFTDYIFGPLNVTLPWDIDDKIEWITTNHRTYIDTTSEGYVLGQYKTTILSIDLGSNEIEIFDEVPVELSKDVIVEFANSNPQQKYTPVSITFDSGKTKIKVAENISNPLQTGDQLTLTVRLDGVLDYDSNKFIIKGENYVNLEVLSTGNQLYFYSIAFLNTYDISTVVYNNPNTEITFSTSKPKAGIAGFVETGILLEDDMSNTGNSDNDRILFYATPTNVYIDKADNKKSKFQKKGGALNKSFADALKILLPDIEFEKTVLNLNPDPVNIFSLTSKAKVKETIFLLGLTRIEWDVAKAAIPTNFHQQFFKFLSTSNSKTDTDSNTYYEYELQVAGEDASGNFQMVNTGIKVYSKDLLVYVSAEFGKRFDIDTTLAMQTLDDFINQTLYYNGKDFSKYKNPNLNLNPPNGKVFYFSKEEWINLSTDESWLPSNKELFDLDSSMKTKIEEFKNALDDNNVKSKSQIEKVLKEKGADLLKHAKAHVKGKDPITGIDITPVPAFKNKDGILYLPRLIMSVIIRNHPKIKDKYISQTQNLLDVFEKNSRGLEGTEKPAFSPQTTTDFNILISGFDPFDGGQDWQDHISNPSGNIALALDGEILFGSGSSNKKATIKSGIFPVRYREFNNKWIEEFFETYVNDDKIKMIITFSYGFSGQNATNSYFQLDRIASRKRNPTLTDNDNQSGGTSPYLEQSNKNSYEFIQNTLGKGSLLNNYSDWIDASNHFFLSQKYQGTFDGEDSNHQILPTITIGSTRVDDDVTTLVQFPDVTDLTFQPIYVNDRKINAQVGSGGSYLSNEIHYRVAFLRQTLKPAKRTGHIHVGFLKGKLNGSASDNRDTMLNIIRKTLEDNIIPNF